MSLLELKHIRYWFDHYAHPGVSDQRSVENAVICENEEFLRTLQAQLNVIAQGNFEEESLNRTVGQVRKLRHGSYAQWAKLMLQWIQSARKH